MSQETVLTLFVIIAAAAVVMQAGVMLGIWLAIRKVPGQIEGVRADFRNHFDPLARSVMEIVNISRDPLRTLITDLAEISQLMRQRSSQADAVFADLLEKSRAQVGRADQLLSNLADKVEETTDRVQQSVLSPILEISAVVKGIQHGLDFLFFRRRPSGSPAGPTEGTQDEQQLFI